MHHVESVIVEAPGAAPSEMEIFLFEPSGAGPHPALILAQHIPVGHTGIENDTFTLAAGERFADAGFVVAAPFIFHWWPKDAEMTDKARASRDDWTVPAAINTPMSAVLPIGLSRPSMHLRGNCR